MAEHVYTKADLITRFDDILDKTFADIDNKGIFEHVKQFGSQKGIAGTIIEQCVLGYDPDTKQEPDLVVVDGHLKKKTELKTTGMVLSDTPKDHFVAKEPMSITAVGIYDIAEQTFDTSHFWSKLEHMLLVYYHYAANQAVPPYEYRDFPIKGYEFHEFTEDEINTLQTDWEYVRALAERVVANHPGERDKAWKEAVKQEYIDVHGELRRVLSYIDLAPKFPPRFRLKKPVVSSIINKHFGFDLEQLPGKYSVVSDIDRKCHELTQQYSGMTIGELAKLFNVFVTTEAGGDPKSVAEQIVVNMFGGTSQKLNQIELFTRFGLIGKTIVTTAKGGRTEDMKLFHVDFDEVTRKEVIDEDGSIRPILFEDSELYQYFADHAFLCIIFEEPALEKTGKKSKKSLSDNKFVGFKRLVFGDNFIDGPVRTLWEDIRNKVLNNTLIDVVQTRADGTPITISTGEISSAPNFMKSSQNAVFMRGSGKNSSMQYKKECVNGIHMLPQYVWLKGLSVIEELEKVPEL
jgi:hypothetical protein